MSPYTEAQRQAAFAQFPGIADAIGQMSQMVQANRAAQANRPSYQDVAAQFMASQAAKSAANRQEAMNDLNPGPYVFNYPQPQPETLPLNEEGLSRAVTALEASRAKRAGKKPYQRTPEQVEKGRMAAEARAAKVADRKAARQFKRQMGLGYRDPYFTVSSISPQEQYQMQLAATALNSQMQNDATRLANDNQYRQGMLGLERSKVDALANQAAEERRYREEMLRQSGERFNKQYGLDERRLGTEEEAQDFQLESARRAERNQQIASALSMMDDRTRAIVGPKLAANPDMELSQIAELIDRAKSSITPEERMQFASARGDIDQLDAIIAMLRSRGFDEGAINRELQRATGDVTASVYNPVGRGMFYGPIDAWRETWRLKKAGALDTRLPQRENSPQAPFPFSNLP